MSLQKLKPINLVELKRHPKSIDRTIPVKSKILKKVINKYSHRDTGRLFENPKQASPDSKVKIYSTDDKHRLECVMRRKRDIQNANDMFII